jgi:hypothetical protein
MTYDPKVYNGVMTIDLQLLDKGHSTNPGIYAGVTKTQLYNGASAPNMKDYGICKKLSALRLGNQKQNPVPSG